MSCLLIHPPLVKPSEPPPGIARLAGALEAQGVACNLLDANIEGILHLLGRNDGGADTWTRRACRHLSTNLATIRDETTGTNPDRYRRAVSDINRVLQKAGQSRGLRLSLSDYHDDALSPLRSEDCLRAFEHPEATPFFPFFEERIPEILKTAEPDIIGVSLNYLSQALTTFALVGYLRRLVPAATIAVGGGLATSWKRSPAWSDPFKEIVDVWVDGPGEGPLLSLFEKGTHDKNSAPSYTASYDGLPLDSYLSPGRIIPYSASTGCYWRKCSFCPERAEATPYRPVPPKQAVGDLANLVKFHQPALIHLLDNAVSPALLKELVRTPPGAPWYGFVRFTERLADPGFCVDLKRSGCVMLKLGLESGSQDVLDGLGKGIDLDQASVILENLRQAGIATYVYLLFGTPGETRVEARKTADYVIRHSRAIDFLNLAIFNLPAWSPEADSLPVDPFYEGDLMLYRNFAHPRGWNRPRVRQFIDKEFRRHPSIAEIVRRDPPFFTSNHAAFFTRRSAPL